MPSADDLEQVRDLLGREPLADFEVVVRGVDGGPVVIRNATMLRNGRPLPTQYWLVGRAECTAVSRLEASGGVRRAERELPPEAIETAHRRYELERTRQANAEGADPEHRATGGVAGTRMGVKCLHAHYAWFLAGGDDPVGAWVAEQLADDGGTGTAP